MDPRQEKQRIAAQEKEHYLSKLHDQAERRATTKDLRDRAIQARAEAEAITSKQYLTEIARRSQFRADVKSTWQESRETHAEMLHQLGLLYKERLSLGVGRRLESARVRASFEAKSGKTARAIGACAPLPLSGPGGVDDFRPHEREDDQSLAEASPPAEAVRSRSAEDPDRQNINE